MKKKLIEVEVFDCGIEHHRHATAATTRQCVAVRMNKLKDYYKRLRISYKILTTRIPIKALAREFGESTVVIRNSLKLVIRELYGNLKPQDAEEHSYVKSLDNVTTHAEFWTSRIEIASHITEQKIDNLREYE